MTVELTDSRVSLRGTRGRTLLVHFDDRHIWTFTGPTAEWPHVLRPYLDGATRVRVTDTDGTTWCDVEHTFGSGEGRVRFVDEAGHPYAVDKAGHLTRSFSSTSEATKQEILEATQVVLRELRERCGVEAYLGYGALLGAVREGGMIAHDSDTDLCYFSHHSDPVDIIRENHRIERELKLLGWDVLRMSAADLKVVWPLADGRRIHVDVFASFVTGGELYVLGEKRGPFDLADLVPLGTVTLDGQEFAAPRNPEAMLVYLYGEGWRVPDPGFVAVADPLTKSRLDGWFRGFRQGMSGWTPLLRGTAGPRSKVPTHGSDFAAWVHEQIGADDAVLDLGAGNGRDSVWFAQQGHPVRSSDYSRRSAVEVRAALEATGVKGVRIKQVILNETRHVLHLVAVLSRRPHHVYARQLVGCLDGPARENLFRLGASALRGGQSMWLEFAVPHPGAPAPEPVGLVERVEPGVLTAEIERSGGRVEHLEIAPGLDMFDNPDPAVARMRATWPAVPRADRADNPAGSPRGNHEESV